MNPTALLRRLGDLWLRVIDLRKRVVDLRPGEFRRVVLGFFSFFLAIFGYYVLKPARDSLFLEHLGAKSLPYFYLASPIFLLAAVAVYRRMVDRLGRRALVLSVYAVAVGCALLFWLLYRLGLPHVTPAFYVWLSVFNLFVVLMFWTVANDVFSPEQGRRLYGFVGAGGIAGGMAGGWATDLLAVRLGTVDLLAVAAAIWALCAASTLALLRETREARGAARPGAAHGAAQPATALSWGERLGFLRDPYALAIAFVVAGGTFLGTVFTLEFNSALGSVLTVRDARTAYFGFLYFRMNLIGLLIQVFITPFVHRTWGPGAGLAFLPVAFLGVIGMISGTPELGMLGLTYISVGSLAYSINQSSRELLYVPTDRDFRWKAKAVIDAFCFRLGDAVASALALALGALAVTTRWLFLPGIAIALGWLAAAMWLEREFRARVTREENSRTPPAG